MFTNAYKAMKNLIVKNRRIVVVLIHFIQIVLANYFAFILRFESVLEPEYISQFLIYLPMLVIIRLTLYLGTGLYKDLWRYSSINDLVKIFTTASAGSMVFLIFVRYLVGDVSYPRSIYVLDWLLLIMLSGGSRFFIRVFREYLQSESSGKRILIIGAGDAGEMIVRDMKNNPEYSYDPIGFIDDDRYKKGLAIHGVPIFGTREFLVEAVEKHRPDEILISMPSESYKTIREIYEQCKPLGLPIKTLPGLMDIIEGNVSVSQIKPLSLEDLLQRDVVRADISEVKEYIEGRSVLVTGAGGSIGSELCRQIAGYSPSVLIMFDRYENGLFQIDMELRANKKSPFISTVVGDMLDVSAVRHIFGKYKPQIVFHAAAHKHVPLMELNPLEALKNNIFGTRNLLEAAAENETESFVTISTDKAVNPENIMGASKRVAEFLTYNMNRINHTRFTTVRFGNVLGSNGSVVQIFKEQLSRGGPLTVTHPEIKRFFMLIPEAVQLVLIAAASGKGGDIFVLDMGEQIKIVDLAENLIRLSGFIPHEDIKIEYTGLRPGEKMYEELFDDSEEVAPTSNEKLRLAIPKCVPSNEEINRLLGELEHMIIKNSVEEAVSVVQKIVPGFRNHQSFLAKSGA
jgi:FlaA1/EpsC-like NDP-sugar epimerase